MKVKHITLLTVAALVALLFVGGAAAVALDSQVSNGAADNTKLSATYSTDADSSLNTGVVTATSLKAADGVVEAAKGKATVVSTGSNLATAADKTKSEAVFAAAREATFALNTENAQNAAAKVETSLVAATSDKAQNPAAKFSLNDDDKRRLILDGVTYFMAAKDAAAYNTDSTVTFNENVYRKATAAQLSELRALENTAPEELAKAFMVMTSNSGQKVLLDNVLYEKVADSNNAAGLVSAAGLQKTVSNLNDNSIILNGATYKTVRTNNADTAVTGTVKLNAQSVSSTDARDTRYSQIMNSMLNNGRSSSVAKNIATVTPVSASL